MPVPTALANLPPHADIVATYYSGANPIYVGFSSLQARHALPTITSATKYNPCALTITAHKIPPQARIRIYISGVTGTGWTALNAADGLVATYYDVNTVTVPIDSTAFGTFGGTVVVLTSYPTTDQPVWAIQGTVYDTSLNAVLQGWAEGSQAMNKILDNRSTYAY